MLVKVGASLADVLISTLFMWVGDTKKVIINFASLNGDKAHLIKLKNSLENKLMMAISFFSENLTKPSLPRPPQLAEQQPETPEHVREFIRNLGK